MNSATFSESSCFGCGGKCCRFVDIELSYRELLTMQDGNRVEIVTEEQLEKISTMYQELGTGMLEFYSQGLYLVPTEFRTKHGEFVYKGFLIGKCGFNDQEGSCTIYLKRPSACEHSFPPGGLDCMITIIFHNRKKEEITQMSNVP